MRVTNKMLSNSFLSDMNVNLQNMSTLQSQMTSGKQFKNASDDPVKSARAMQLNKDIAASKQYKNNILSTVNFLDTTDTALNQVGNVFQSINEKLVSAGNAAYGSDERKAIKNTINEQVGHLAQILNTNFDGKYIFGGTRGTDKPVIDSVDPITKNRILGYATTDDKALAMINKNMDVEISQGVTMSYNKNTTDVFNFIKSDGTTGDLRTLLSDIIKNLDSTDSTDIAKLTNENLSDMKAAMNNLLKVRSEVGSMQNRMDDAASKNTDEIFNLTEILSKTEDIDITEKTMEYATMQTVYMASLQTSAKVLQPTLLDYL